MYVEEKCNAYEYLGLDPLLQGVGLCVRTGYRGMRIGQKVLAASSVASRKHALVVATFIASCLYLLFCYKYNTQYIDRTNTKHKKQLYKLTKHSEEIIDEIKDPNYVDNDLENFLISTSGCSIPNYGLNIKYAAATGKAISCGKRAVFIKKISNEKIVFFINTDELRKRVNKELTPEQYRCCYMFVSRSKTKGTEDTSISYTYCNNFSNGSIKDLQSEVIKVYCYIEVLTKIIYEDSYMLVKKVSRKENDVKINATRWNVIMLGMDSMSRARLFGKMPELGAFLRTNQWLDYRGYNTVGRNTYPNIISLLTGMKLSTMEKACRPDMFACNEYFLWSRFREAGYVTAYGEDYLSLSDTFHPWNGFSSIPTDHYMRPLFLTGEQKSGVLICTKQLSSGKHILKFAQDFADTYRNDRYFGYFWTNSFSHNPENQPGLFENDILKLLRTLTQYENTFIVLLGDHGMQFGPDRMQMESYYDYRLPMLFIWTPTNFIKQHVDETNNLIFNQRRLISPYDMHLTLLKLSNMSVNIGHSSEGCPTCQPLFKEVSPHRTCKSAGIDELYCSCHQLATINIQEHADTQQSLKTALHYVAEKSKSVATSKCMKCVPLVLSKVLRAHTFTDSNNSKKYYVLAWEMQPQGVKYEALVRKDDGNFTIVSDISGKNMVPLISYDVHGYCTKAADRMWCVCQKAC